MSDLTPSYSKGGASAGSAGKGSLGKFGKFVASKVLQVDGEGLGPVASAAIAGGLFDALTELIESPNSPGEAIKQGIAGAIAGGVAATVEQDILKCCD